jgi:hypothetical protein
MNFFDHKDLGIHFLQLCPKVVKHPVYCILPTQCICVFHMILNNTQRLCLWTVIYNRQAVIPVTKKIGF